MNVVGFKVAVLAVLFFLYRTGRVKSRFELVMAAGLIVAVGVWLGRNEAQADTRARATVATLFDLGPGIDIGTLSRSSSKGAPTQVIEAIVAFSPGQFEVYRAEAAVSLDGVSFKYRTGGLDTRTLASFAVAEGALDWAQLPRPYPGLDGFYPQRGHYSRQRTPDERDMTGRYVCAFIPVTPADETRPDRDAVIPCGVVRDRKTRGVTILGVLNEQDRTLHVMIS